MNFVGMKKASWIFLILLPLISVFHVEGRHKRALTDFPSSFTETRQIVTTLSSIKTRTEQVVTTPSSIKIMTEKVDITPSSAKTKTEKVITSSVTETETERIQFTLSSPYNSTSDKNNETLDYEMNYYEYPAELFANETYNDTYGLGGYYDGYYDDYYGMYDYPEFDTYYDERPFSTKNMTQETTKKQENSTKKPKSKRSRRKTRSVVEERHLCVRYLINVSNIFDKYIPNIFECKNNQSRHFAYLNVNGFPKPFYLLKDEKNPDLVPLCIKKGNVSYVTTCNSMESQSFCFADTKKTNRITKCNDHKRRVCFKGGLTICYNQEKKRIPRGIVKPHKNKKKPDVNCHNCEVEVKMVVDEMADNSPPKVQIKVSKLDPLENLMDDADIDFDK